MIRSLSKLIFLNLLGWKITGNVPEDKKIIAIVVIKNPMKGNGQRYLLLLSSLTGGHLTRDEMIAEMAPKDAHNSKIIKL